MTVGLMNCEARLLISWNSLNSNSERRVMKTALGSKRCTNAWTAKRSRVCVFVRAKTLKRKNSITPLLLIFSFLSRLFLCLRSLLSLELSSERVFARCHKRTAICLAIHTARVPSALAPVTVCVIDPSLRPYSLHKSIACMRVGGHAHTYRLVHC